MPDERDDFQPSDIPHSVVIQEALAPYLGGFEQAEEAAHAAYRVLAVTYQRVIVDAEDLAHDQEELRQLRASLCVADTTPAPDVEALESTESHERAPLHPMTPDPA